MKLAVYEALGVGLDTLPNPRVGAVVVKDGSVVSAACTQKYGGKHAEAVAIEKAGRKAQGAVLFCTLEPCTGFWKGKNQAPCAEKIVAAGIKEVYIACQDKNKKINGKGIAYLEQHGVKVNIDTEYTLEYKRINDVFEHLQHRSNSAYPYVHVKIAQTENGYMTGRNYERIAITGKAAQNYVHRMRAMHQVLITSANTINTDDPLYTVRNVEGISPALVLIDSQLKINLGAKILHQKVHRRNIILEIGKNQRSATHGGDNGDFIACGEMGISTGIFIATSPEGFRNKAKREKLEAMGVVVKEINSQSEGGWSGVDLKFLLRYLLSQKIYSVMVEAGPRLSSAFIKNNYVTKLSYIISEKRISDGIGIGDFLPSIDKAVYEIYKGNIPLHTSHADLFRIDKQKLQETSESIDIAIDADSKDITSNISSDATNNELSMDSVISAYLYDIF